MARQLHYRTDVVVLHKYARSGILLIDGTIVLGGLSHTLHVLLSMAKIADWQSPSIHAGDISTSLIDMPTFKITTFPRHATNSTRVV